MDIFDLLNINTLIICCASLIAGLIDAMVGGGGLILVPTLFSIFPNIPAPTLFGTNKIASICGTSNAAWQYAKRVQLPWQWLLPASICCFFGALLGAYAITQFDGQKLRLGLPFLLLAVFIYTLINKRFGQATEKSPKHATHIGLGLGLLIGFYDGFFGPGTGSFLTFAFIFCFGIDFLTASASAKIANIACNIAALLLFGIKGHLWWALGLLMALANIAGAQIGSYLALKHGTHFVRKVFLVLVSCLIARTFYDGYFK